MLKRFEPVKKQTVLAPGEIAFFKNSDAFDAIPMTVISITEAEDDLFGETHYVDVQMPHGHKTTVCLSSLRHAADSLTQIEYFKLAEDVAKDFLQVATDYPEIDLPARSLNDALRRKLRADDEVAAWLARL